MYTYIGFIGLVFTFNSYTMNHMKILKKTSPESRQSSIEFQVNNENGNIIANASYLKLRQKYNSWYVVMQKFNLFTYENPRQAADITDLLMYSFLQYILKDRCSEIYFDNRKLKPHIIQDSFTNKILDQQKYNQFGIFYLPVTQELKSLVKQYSDSF